MSETVIVYDTKTKGGTIIKNLVETPPTAWTNERIAKYIKEYLAHMPGVINIRCNNAAVLALL